MSRKILLGELLIQQNLVSQDVIDSALRIQVGGNRRLGYILVRMKAISADQLAEILAKQINIPIIDITREFSPEVKTILPRYLCRQYGVLPLTLKQNNILQVAMANPSDEEAIADLEHYTGKVVEPCLARHSDIDKEISRKIPMGMRDLFTPQRNIWATRAAAALSLVLVIGLFFFTFDYIQKIRYGTVSTNDTYVLYKNHDLIIGVDKEGKLSLLGHGAFSKGFYSVSFDNTEALREFIKNRKEDFSEKQLTWLEWALKEKARDGLVRTLAVKKQ